MLNTVLIIITFAVLLVFFLWFVRTAKLAKYDREILSKPDIDFLYAFTRDELSRIAKEDSFDDSFANSEYDSRWEAKSIIIEALDRCVDGRLQDKIIVIDLIKTIISKILTTEEEIDDVYNFNDHHTLPYNVRFEMVMHYYKKEYYRDALEEIIKKFNIDAPKKIIEDKTQYSYAFLPEELDRVYSDMLNNTTITKDDKLDVIARIIYQMLKGFDIVDTISEMNVDGWNVGASGAVILEDIDPDKLTFHKSVWVQYHGKYIHFRFLEFKDMKNLRRVVTLVSRFNSPGALTQSRGYLINQMADMSRVAAFRPPLADCWAVFIRKFSKSRPVLTKLLQQVGFTNVDLPATWIKFSMKGQRNAAFTGRQSSGKTTAMKAAPEFISPMLNTRTLEMSREMYCREHYPERNMLGLTETPTVSASAAQDALKKSDAAVTVVGEVATDEIAGNMVQSARVASNFTFFSHHAQTMPALIYAIRNSLVNSKGYDMEAAERLVIDAIDINFHHDFGTNGKRFIHRVSERIILAEEEEYPEYNSGDGFNSINKITREYYKRITDRTKFTCQDLVKFDVANETYYVPDGVVPSQELIDGIMSNLSNEERKEFAQFIAKWYGNNIRKNVVA